jgi:Putative protein-S-isoprenylcysteine methyltransferase
MLGMLVATGLAVSYLPVLVIAVVIFIAGTVVRIRSEDKLLRETFGATFDDYARAGSGDCSRNFLIQTFKRQE